jgi:hypothetical protein
MDGVSLAGSLGSRNWILQKRHHKNVEFRFSFPFVDLLSLFDQQEIAQRGEAKSGREEKMKLMICLLPHLLLSDGTNESVQFRMTLSHNRMKL